MDWHTYQRAAYLGADPSPGRTASSYRDHRGPVALQPARTAEMLPAPRRHHFHDVPPWPQQRYGDYVPVQGWGWWPRWYPYWDRRWYDYWWYLYDAYGGDTNPAYAEYARDAYLRQYAPQWGLSVGSWIGAAPQQRPIVHDPRGSASTYGAPSYGALSYGAPSQRYHHPHDYYGDYIVVGGVWWPHWFPYWDPAWVRYWWQLYYYYGGDQHADYAQYARDAYLRANAARLGWTR